MNQEIPTINTVNKTEKIKNLFLNNKKKNYCFNININFIAHWVLYNFRD